MSAQHRRQLRVVLAITVLSYATLYAPQPLLPLFAERFGLSRASVGLLISATLLPLSIAPLSYGSLLQRVSPTLLLRASVLVLAASQLAFALASSFPALLGIRLLQGLVLPAVLTALMTSIALASPGSGLRWAMSVYVAASIVGGYLGRLLSGFGAAYLGWRAFFIVLAAGLCAGGLALDTTVRPARERARTAGLREIVELVRRPAYRGPYLLAFIFFFVFAGLLNYLPFRLTELQGRTSAVHAGLIYTGFLLGVVTSLGSRRIVSRLGGDGRALVFGFAAYGAALLLMLVPSVPVLFATVFLFCGAMFFLHAVAAGLVNQRAGERAGIANGLYLSFYYAGGVLGSYLPGFVYEAFGWTAFVALLVAGVLLGSLVALRTAAHAAAESLLPEHA